ncbi:hypothetical protein NDA11_003116 [Ustilago hordei]|uniref:DASH complex subunit DAD3 n=1 Tax=Ustilago hordei TaxID=120017 RepID=I2FXB4_USTHO|nr:uncharacterized protein UHO2_04365 [Ustilago hordei]KAJ1036960.1 hypothetical protein NDA10_003998 [Ustilago hordei]KAJ1573838.1 hypothetical protein NDA15_005105 [Ustilago hordei]KAJ1579308.1 hypothetical protein NDA11_003116 [Ustilago hordei]KAJ1579685.1 hypothetical protein NDA12_004617 [Ustilago hordei]KAJ1598631.1 hypothetical protein NDA14_005383 [Ustilago hordei]
MATIQEVLDQVAALPTASKPYINPYAGHRALSEHEQELLGEYARLADTIRRVAALSTILSSSSAHASLLTQLRVLERKMGLVLTLYKASVWATVQEQAEMAEAEAMAAAGAEMNGYSMDMQMGMYDQGEGGAYYYGGGAPSESREADDTVVMRQNEHY